MLKARYRFHGHGSLRYLYSLGRTVRGRSVALRFVSNPRRADSRCAVVIAKKVIKSSPKRNRVRRRIYEVVRVNWSCIKPGSDMLITAYEPHLYDMPPGELSSMIVELLKQADLWSEPPATSQKP